MSDWAKVEGYGFAGITRKQAIESAKATLQATADRYGEYLVDITITDDKGLIIPKVCVGVNSVTKEEY